MAKLYGTMPSEKIAEENRIARDIVKEISTFGITERQRIMIMYLLSLEIENVDDMKQFSSFIKEKKGNDLFLTGRVIEES